jgi:glycosyltransferase involved in cell wall biosynthesis
MNPHSGDGENVQPKDQDQLRVAVWIGLDDKKSLEKLRGLDASPLVQSGLVFRRHPTPGLSGKFRQIVPPRPLRKSALLAHAYALCMTLVVCLRFRPHVCISVSLLPHGFLARLGSILARSKFAVWYIGTDMYRHLHSPVLRPFKPMLRRADCTLVMGENSRNKLVAMGWPGRRVLVGHNAYNLEKYFPVKPDQWEWDLIYTGRLDIRIKGLDFLLQALKEALPDLPRLRCALVGEGPDHHLLEQQAQDLGLKGHVSFLGRCDDIPGLLQTSKVFIMTSAWEGLPASLIEAFACGVPAIVPDVGDIRTIARDGDNCLLVQEHAPRAYAQAITRLLMNEALRTRLARGAAETGVALRTESYTRSAQAWGRLLAHHG